MVKTLLVVVAAAVVGLTAIETSGASQPLLTQGSCRQGSKPAVIGGTFKCLKLGQACNARYQNTYKRYGFRCVAGHLKRATSSAGGGGTITPPPAPPPPPPAPPAAPGHYKGLTSQLTTFEFDVTADGFRLTNLRTGQVNAGCTPPAHFYGGEIDLGSYLINVSSDGNFVVEWAYHGALDDGTPYSGHTKITGHFSGPTATGTLETNFGFNYQGTGYACGSGLQTWSASRTG